MAMTTSVSHTFDSNDLIIPDFFAGDREKYMEFLLSKDYLCAVCREVPYKPYTGHCGALLCCDCLDKSYQQKPNKCPKCNTNNITKLCFSPNMQAKTLISELKGKCVCEFIGTLEEISVHRAKTCPLRSVKCKTCSKEYVANKEEEHVSSDCIINCDYCKQNVSSSMILEHKTTCMMKCTFCSVKILTSTMGEHKDICTERPHICEQCNLSIPHSTRDHHISSDCHMTTITCKHGCGDSHVRISSNKHEKTCGHVMVRCNICPHHMCMRKELEEHKKANIALHFDYIIMKQQENFEYVRQENSELREKYEALTLKFDESEKKIETLSCQLKECGWNRTQIPAGFAALSQQVAEFMSKTEGEKTVGSFMAGEIMELKSQVKELLSKLAVDK
jgi:hypothetical protein